MFMIKPPAILKAFAPPVQRDLAVQSDILGLKDLAHPARTDGGEDFVGPRRLPERIAMGLRLSSDRGEYNSVRDVHTCKFFRDATGGQ